MYYVKFMKIGVSEYWLTFYTALCSEPTVIW